VIAAPNGSGRRSLDGGYQATDSPNDADYNARNFSEDAKDGYSVPQVEWMDGFDEKHNRQEDAGSDRTENDAQKQSRGERQQS
jgi:hypothetical protein